MKKIVAIILAIVMLFAFTACGSIRKIEYAYITLPNGNVIEVEVDRYFIGTTNVRIIAKDGRECIVSVVNCMLTTDRLEEVKNGSNK